MKALLLAATILLSLAGQQSPPQNKQPQPPVPDKPQPTLEIEEVVFEGNQVFTSEELKRQLHLVGEDVLMRRFGRRNFYTRERFQADAASLLRYMSGRGYLRASIGEPKIRFINIEDAARTSGDVPIRLIIPVSEGYLHRLGNLTVIDGSVLTGEQARALFPIKTGDVIDAGQMDDVLNRMRIYYGRLGHLQFAPTIDFKFAPAVKGESVTDITIRLNEGKRFTLGRLEFSGNRRTLDLPLRRIIPLTEGDFFDFARLEEGINRLNRTNLFEPITTADAIITYDQARVAADVELRLKELDVQRIDVSGGAGTFGSFSIGLDYSNINLTGRLDSFAALLRLGNLEQTVSARYGTTLMTARPVTLNYSGSFQRYVFVDAQTQGENRRPLYIQTAGGLGAGVTVPLAKGRNTLGAATVGSLFYSLNFNSLEDLVAQRASTASDIQQSNIRLASLTPALTHDTLDRNFDPLRGMRMTTGVEVADRAFGGNINTVRPWVDFRQFIPLNPGMLEGERNVFGYRLRAAHIASFGRPFEATTLSVINGVPIFSRYFVGGMTEVRGYPINSIAPLARVDRLLAIGNNPPVLINSNVQPIGGDTQLIANAEYRAPVMNRLSMAAFFDIGSSFNAQRLEEERFVSPVQLVPPIAGATLTTVVRPLGDVANQIPNYRISLGGELRILVPVVNLPLRLIFAYNPNAQVNPPPTTLLAPEKRFVFVFGLGRTL
jgi:outer membrane protein insertion porin family